MWHNPPRDTPFHNSKGKFWSLDLNYPPGSSNSSRIPGKWGPRAPDWRCISYSKWGYSGSTISTLLHDRINPKNCQVLSLGDTGFPQFFRVVSRDYGKPRYSIAMLVYQRVNKMDHGMDPLDPDPMTWDTCSMKNLHRIHPARLTCRMTWIGFIRGILTLTF